MLFRSDPRLIDKPYGRRIWQSLPGFARTRLEPDVLRFFQQLAADRKAASAAAPASAQTKSPVAAASDTPDAAEE